MKASQITDDQIATLCDVVRLGGSDVSLARGGTLKELIVAGYVAQKQPDPARYVITPAGQAVLDERGVGANES